MSTDLAIVDQAPVTARQPAPTTEETWRVMCHQAKTLVDTGFLPKQIDTPQKAVAVMLKGRELGIAPMYALSNIVIVNGKPTCQAELLLALIYRDHGDNALIVTETDAKHCTVEYRRRNWETARSYTFAWEDAERVETYEHKSQKKVKLTDKDTWKSYPAAMLRARCISAVARMAFPDSIGGLHTPEELGVPVQVQGDGQVVVSEIVDPEVVKPTGDGRSVNTETGEVIEQTKPDAPKPANGHDLTKARNQAIQEMGVAMKDAGLTPKDGIAALGISASKGADLSLPEIQQLTDWARTQAELKRTNTQPAQDPEPAAQQEYVI